MKDKHYSEYRHPEYDANQKKWDFAQKVYDATAYDAVNIGDFLPKKVQRESEQAYEERKLLLDPQMHFPTGIDSLVGVMFDAEKEADRIWQDPEKIEGLGDPKDDNSISSRLLKNADGDDTNWDFIPKQSAIKFTLKKKLWGLIDGRPKDEDGNSIGDARFKIIDPETVVNWFENEKTGVLEWVLVKERRDTRKSYKEDPSLQDGFVEYTLEGWRRFHLDKDGNEIEDGNGSYAYYTTKARNQRALPIYCTEIVLPRNPGYTWAKKSNAIQNFESRLDFAHMTITFALLQFAGNSDNFEKFKKEFKEGMNVLNVHPESSRDHKFLTQDSSYFDTSEKRLAKKIEDFYKNMFKDFGDAAAQRTAQEIRLESKSGIEAFLSLLVGAVDEFENQALWRISQVYFPNTPDVWGDAFVNRTADFAPKDVDAALQKLKDRYVGEGPLPVDNKTRAEMIVRIIEEDGGEIDDKMVDRIEEHLNRSIDKGLADAIARIASVNGLSAKTIVESLFPEWDESRVNKELTRIRQESGAEPVPPEQIGA